MTSEQLPLVKLVSSQLQISEKQVKNTIQLLQDGATIPFISRYRKEMTGDLDEVSVGAIKDVFEKLSELQKRKETIISTIEELGKMTNDLRFRIDNCLCMMIVEILNGNHRCIRHCYSNLTCIPDDKSRVFYHIFWCNSCNKSFCNHC